MNFLCKSMDQNKLFLLCNFWETYIDSKTFDDCLRFHAICLSFHAIFVYKPVLASTLILSPSYFNNI